MAKLVIGQVVQRRLCDRALLSRLACFRLDPGHDALYRERAVDLGVGKAGAAGVQHHELVVLEVVQLPGVVLTRAGCPDPLDGGGPCFVVTVTGVPGEQGHQLSIGHRVELDQAVGPFLRPVLLLAGGHPYSIALARRAAIRVVGFAAVLRGISHAAGVEPLIARAAVDLRIVVSVPVRLACAGRGIRGCGSAGRRIRFDAGRWALAGGLGFLARRAAILVGFVVVPGGISHAVPMEPPTASAAADIVLVVLGLLTCAVEFRRAVPAQVLGLGAVAARS